MELFYLYLLNLVVTVGLFLATLYRVKIERDMIQTTMENARYKLLIEKFKTSIEKDRDLLREHCSDEFYEMLLKFFDG